jgi:predicted transcriptional regulator
VAGTKQQILKALQGLPEDAGVEDALDRLYLFYKVEKGVGQADRGELISHDDVRKRIASRVLRYNMTSTRP